MVPRLNADGAKLLGVMCCMVAVRQAHGETRQGDFNGDGYADLAVSVVGERVGGFDFAGAVHVLYGSATGLKSTADQFWNGNSSGLGGSVQSIEEEFGAALAIG